MVKSRLIKNKATQLCLLSCMSAFSRGQFKVDCREVKTLNSTFGKQVEHSFVAFTVSSMKSSETEYNANCVIWNTERIYVPTILRSAIIFSCPAIGHSTP